MNWIPINSVDEPVPLPPGWQDVWLALRPGEDGWTYDTEVQCDLSCAEALWALALACKWERSAARHCCPCVGVAAGRAWLDVQHRGRMAAQCHSAPAC